MSASEPLSNPIADPLAIICCGGTLPFAVAEAARRQGRPVVLFPVRGTADAQAVAAFPHHWLWLGQFGHFVRIARAEGCRDVVAIGSLIRPSLWNIHFDLFTLRLLPRIARAFRHGDDGMLSGIGALLEDNGFRLLGAQDVAPEILMPPGVIGHKRPTQSDQTDIRRGLELLRATGPFDVGQAAIVTDNRVLSIEAAEGTDAMLARLAELRDAGRIQARQAAGVLVKAPKQGQDRRFDMPSIGPRTVEGVARAGLAGIAVVAGSVIVAELDRIAAVADRAKVFVVGVSDDGAIA